MIIRKKKNSKIGTKSTPRRHKVPKIAIFDLLIFNKLRKKQQKIDFSSFYFSLPPQKAVISHRKIKKLTKNAGTPRSCVQKDYDTGDINFSKCNRVGYCSLFQGIKKPPQRTKAHAGTITIPPQENPATGTKTN